MNRKQKLFLLAGLLVSAAIACNFSAPVLTPPTPFPSAAPAGTLPPAISTVIPTASPSLPPKISVQATQTAAPPSASTYTFLPFVSKPAGELSVTGFQPAAVELARSASCLSGPGKFYSVIDSLDAGEIFIIDGRNGDNSWWRIQIPDLAASCWVSARFLTVTGDPAAVPILPTPSLPADTPTLKPSRTPTATIALPATDNQRRMAAETQTPTYTYTPIIGFTVAPGYVPTDTPTIANTETQTPTDTFTAIIPPETVPSATVTITLVIVHPIQPTATLTPVITPSVP